jgi:hypothetical protein
MLSTASPLTQRSGGSVSGGAEITEQIYREHGEIDPETINALFRGDDETRPT